MVYHGEFVKGNYYLNDIFRNIFFIGIYIYINIFRNIFKICINEMYINEG